MTGSPAVGGWSQDPLLDESGCRALVVAAGSSRDPDVAHFVGRVHLGDCLLVLPRGGRPRLGFLTAMEREEAAASGLDLLTPADLEPDDAAAAGRTDAERWRAVFARALELSGVRPGPVALAGRARAGVMAEAWAALSGSGWSVRSGDDLARRLRKAKRDWELAEARRAARGVSEAMRAVAGLLAGAQVAGADAREPGALILEGESLKVARLRQEIRTCLARHGLHEPEGNIVAAGRDAGIPHSQGASDRVLKSGETLVVDLYPRDRVFADCTRTFCVGEVPEAVGVAWGAVLRALVDAHASARPGAVGRDLQVVACRGLEAAGYATLLSEPGAETGYVHNLGHGVGLELHEYPSFREGAGPAGLLEVGDLLTLEPGLYDPGAGWGLRLEDLVYLGAEGNETLTQLPYDLDPRAWG